MHLKGAENHLFTFYWIFMWFHTSTPGQNAFFIVKRHIYTQKQHNSGNNGHPHKIAHQNTINNSIVTING